ncbi:MAG: transcription termination/antitermination protein NusA [Proteobacteria bacterium]|nr:MAG: transcription termination/antitermination protein NusA [Pseudomonadota bacterium]
MSKEVLMLVDVLAKEKNLDKEIVFDSLEKALAFATKRSFDGEFPDIEVHIDRHSGKFRTIRKWTVMSDVDFYDDDKELSLSDVEADPDRFGTGLKIGDVVEEELDNIDLGRVSAQTARNIIAQKIKDAERDQVLNEYLSRNNGIIIGKVRKFERGNAVIDCGKVEAIILRPDLINKEVLKPGDMVKGFFDKANPVIKNGRLSISRASNGFLAKLLENNVPEIANGRVEIKAIARDPGNRSKVAIISHDSRIDAKGAVIGFRNQRIDSVTKELFGEKIDIIEFSDDLAKYALNALAPAEIDSLVVDEEKRRIDVIVEDDKLGSAIGPDGINVRLASMLTNCTIDIYGKTQAKDKKQNERADLMAMFNETLDVDDDISELLVDNGFSSLEEVAYVELADLLVIEDFDEDVAKELQERAKNKLLSKTIIYKDKMDKLADDLASVVKFSPEVLLQLVEHNIMSIDDFAELAGDELMDMISIDLDTANKLIMKAREVCGYFQG